LRRELDGVADKVDQNLPKPVSSMATMAGVSLVNSHWPVRSRTMPAA